MKRIISAFIGVLASLVTLKSAAQIKKNIRINLDNENLLKVDAISNILQQKNIDITKDESLRAVLDDHAILNEILNELGSKENLKSNTSIEELEKLLKINKYYQLQKNGSKYKGMHFDGKPT